MGRAAKRTTAAYVCQDCGTESSRWAGRCESCGAWNTLSEFRPSGGEAARRGAVPGRNHAEVAGLEPLRAGEAQPPARRSTGIPDLDLVLGGGLVPGSFLLCAGEPGVGKSTLMLEVARRFVGKVYYFSGEESVTQIRLRAHRLGVNPEALFLSRETTLERVCESIAADRPDLAIIDSVQTLQSEGKTAAGGAAQLREAALLLMDAARGASTAVLVTGHVTKDGSIAGPRAMEHMTDVVLYFESDRLNHYRILRAVKNRFGPVGESAIFEMRADGLSLPTVVSPISADNPTGPGRVFSALLEGSRAIGVEVQALTTRSHFGQNRRMAEGLDTRRLVLLAAVLEKYLRLNLSECDVFANLAGGLQADDPGLDLALCAAMVSSYREIALPPGTAFFGEVGLTGEVRPVTRIEGRIKELAGVGFRNFFVPGANRTAAGSGELHGIGHVTELVRLLGPGTGPTRPQP